MKKKVYSKENFHTTHSDGRYDRTLGFLYEQFRRRSGARLPSLAGKPDCGPNSYPLRNRQAWWYVKAGMIALAVENPATGINSEPDIAYGEVQLRCLSLLLQLGRTYHGFITEQRLMLLDFLKQYPLVDPEQLACSGLSLGCGGTLYTAVLSDDVKAVVYNDFVCRNVARLLLSTTEISTNPVMACSFIPGANEWFDIQPDLMAALAPRPLLLAEGGSWKNCIEKVVHAYRMLGKKNNLSVKYYPKFSDPASRKFEDIDLLTCEGLTPQEFLERSNVDASQHSFHPELAIPWLTRLFPGTEYNDSPLLAEIRRAKEEKERFFNADDEEIFPGRKS